MHKFSFKINKIKALLYIICVVLMVIQALPYIITEMYTFPIQDDFYYTEIIMDEARKHGIGLLFASIRLTYQYYFEFRGYYFSMFLIFFMDGITACGVRAVRLLQTLSLVSFYLSLSIMLYKVSKHVMRMEKMGSITVTMAVFSLFTGTFYFTNNETLFWMCATSVYLVPFVFLNIYVSLYIDELLEHKNYKMFLCIILGLLIGGASVNVAAFACVAAVLLMYLGGFVLKKGKLSLLIGIPTLLGGMLNVLSPANYAHISTDVPVGEKLLDTIIGTSAFVIDRLKMFITEKPLFLCSIIIICIIIFVNKSSYDYTFPVPVLFTLLMFAGVSVTIFPVQWAGGVKAFDVYERCIIISDWSIYLLLFINLFYWISWIKNRFRIKEFSFYKHESPSVCIAVMIMVMGLIISGDRCASNRLSRELLTGELQKYCDWSVSVVETVRESEDKIVTINATEVPEDSTCMANAFYHIGYYDYTTEYTGNSAMANYFDKDAVYIITEDVE